MGNQSFTVRYAVAMADCGGRCPIEAGVLGKLADHECRHGRLPHDRTPACGSGSRRGASFSHSHAQSRNGRVAGAPREERSHFQCEQGAGIIGA